MNDIERMRAETRADLLKAMAHPTRIFLVDVIERKGAHSVQELTDLVGADMSTVSRHLRLLREAGILTDERQGTTVRYRLGCDCIHEFMSGMEALLRARQKREMAAYSAKLMTPQLPAGDARSV